MDGPIDIIDKTDIINTSDIEDIWAIKDIENIREKSIVINVCGLGLILFHINIGIFMFSVVVWKSEQYLDANSCGVTPLLVLGFFTETVFHVVKDYFANFKVSILCSSMKRGITLIMIDCMISVSVTQALKYQLKNFVVTIFCCNEERSESILPFRVLDIYIGNDEFTDFIVTILCSDIPRTTDAQRGKSLHCTAENSLTLPNF